MLGLDVEESHKAKWPESFSSVFSEYGLPVQVGGKSEDESQRVKEVGM